MKFLLRSLAAWLLAFPAFGAAFDSITYRNTTGSTTLTGDCPATMNSGDGIMVFVGQLAVAAGSPTFSSPTSGYTLRDEDDPGFTMSAAVYTKVADGSEEGAACFSLTSDDNGRAIIGIVRITEVNAFDDSSEGVTDFSTSHTTAALTTAGADQVLANVIFQAQPADPYSPTQPSGMTLGAVQNSGTQIAAALAYVTQAGAGSSGTKAWSNGDSDGTVSMMATFTNAAGGGATIPIFQHHQLQRMQ